MAENKPPSGPSALQPILPSNNMWVVDEKTGQHHPVVGSVGGVDIYPIGAPTLEQREAYAREFSKGKHKPGELPPDASAASTEQAAQPSSPRAGGHHHSLNGPN